MSNSLIILLFGFICNLSNAQVDTIASGGIEFFIHEEVTNANGVVEQELISLWQNYVTDGDFQDRNSPYWSFENMKVPDENFWAIGINTLKKRNYKVQCKVIGIFELENGYWSLIQGLVEALRYGTSDNDFYKLLKDKLGIEKEGLDAYIKNEMHKYVLE